MNRDGPRNRGGYNRPRGPNSNSTTNFAHPHQHVESDKSSGDVPLDRKDKFTPIGRQTSWQTSTTRIPNQFDPTLRSDYQTDQEFPSLSVKDVSSDLGNLKLLHNSPEEVGHSKKHLNEKKSRSSQLNVVSEKNPLNKETDMVSESHSPENLGCSFATIENESSLLPGSVIKEEPSKEETEHTEKIDSAGKSENSVGVPFDICREKTASSGVKLKAPLFAKNREKRKEDNRSTKGQDITILRPGMVHLKSYIPLRDQAKIVNKCRELGMGSGGFYQPGYRDGAKLHLKMMCLGKNWDPETSEYGDVREYDNTKPPVIPIEFHKWVEGAIQESQDYLQKHTKERNVKNIIPSMSPDICIVNFYANSGRLGLHQDKDESAESRRKGLPVVSFSIGDSAEFLYGDEREIDKADKVILESGDVLIFGGKSRDIFHGVKSILQDTAHKSLLEESNLRPGRLNLTFREY